MGVMALIAAVKYMLGRGEGRGSVCGCGCDCVGVEGSVWVGQP